VKYNVFCPKKLDINYKQRVLDCKYETELCAAAKIILFGIKRAGHFIKRKFLLKRKVRLAYYSLKPAVNYPAALVIILKKL
jgi:hypothetical protein